MHKSSTLLFLTIIFLLVIGSTASDAAMIYETGYLSPNGWRFHYSNHSFHTDDSPEAILEVRKNPSGRSPRAGFIVFNHRRVPLKRFLHSQEDMFTRKIKLHRHNRLLVFLFGSPGASISIVIHDSSAAPLPAADFSATPETILSGSSSTLFWTTTHADSCRIEPDIGSVAPAGSVTISPDTTTTYTLTADGPGGSRSATAVVTVNRPAPTVNLAVQPAEIISGESAVLQWSSTDADSCRIDPDVGTVELQGELAVSPSETTTYTITATGSGGSASSSATATVHLPPSATLSVDPQAIAFGESATLSWNAFNANTAVIDQGIGDVERNGSITVSPTATTVYTLTVTGPGGTSNAQTQVVVQSNVAPQPDGSFGQQYEDQIPADATIEAYDSDRFSLITGLVRDSWDLPIEGVSVSILGHGEYGSAITDDQGRFTLPVEGGSTLTVVYQKSDRIPSHRQVYVPWNDIAITETVQMITEDSASTAVTFDGNPETVVAHRSTPVVDEFGSRAATMVFTGDNRAWRVDEHGNDIQELSTITTRATEFATPESMPAELPPTSAYTYCAELSVDEAERVRFDKPVVFWVDNFLGFDVGEIVPVGYYDRDRGVWVPSDNGVVVRLLDTDSDGIVDAVDSDGDDLPDDLDGDGSFSDEVNGLDDFNAYPPGATFWRAAVSHFTPWDCNWPYGPPMDAISPNPEGEPSADQQIEDDCKGSNCSFVEERSRIFHEDIPIPGTDMTLHYASDRVKGYKQVITVPVNGASVPASLKEIIVKCQVSGRTLQKFLSPLPNQRTEIVWDGLDFRGDMVTSPVIADVIIGFVYDAFYYSSSVDFNYAFARVGADPTAVWSRQEVIYWKNSSIKLFPPVSKVSGEIASGWSISSHHQLQIDAPPVLHKGDGALIQNRMSIITTVAGTGDSGLNGDNGPAIQADLYYPRGIAIDPQGNLFIADYFNSRIRKVDPNGIITTVAGNGLGEDGGPAIQAKLNHPADVAIDPRGNLFIADTYNHRIRKVDTDGIITTVAGTGGLGSFDGDGGPAVQAELDTPWGIAIDPLGNLFIADSYNHRIRKVAPNRIITTVAGTGDSGFSGDGGPAIQAKLDTPTRIAIGPQGNLFIADNSNRIRKVDTTGIITTVVGTGDSGFSGDEGPAIQADLSYPLGIAVDPLGNLFIADLGNNRIRKVDSQGIITTVAGTGDSGFSGDGWPAIQAKLYYPSGLAIDPLGNLFIADEINNRIRKVGSPQGSIFSVAINDGEIAFAAPNGIGYIVDNAGNHSKTIDLETGNTLYIFTNDELKDQQLLTSITDQFGNQTTINRYADGTPESITSPDGLTTQVTVDADNHLTHITYTDGSTYQFEYTDDGLLTAKTEPNGNRYEHVFDETGRLAEAIDDEGGHWSYNREANENGDIVTEVMTGEGNLTTYLDHTDSSGTFTSTITDPTGAQTLFSRSGDGLTAEKSLPCGMDLGFTYDLDPEYKFKFVKEMSETAPSGLKRTVHHEKTYEDTDFDDVPDRITETVTQNGKPTIIENDVLQSQKTIISPEGRTITAHYDGETLLTEKILVPGLLDTEYDYDQRGRLTTVLKGTRQASFLYDGEGNLSASTDPRGYTTGYDHDPLGRITTVYRPDAGALYLSYDANGNMTILTNPSAIDHVFGFNGVNLKSAYQTPLSGSYRYLYDADRRLIQINFPSGRQIDNIYDSTRLSRIQTPRNNIDFTYLCGTKIGSIAKGSETILYSYDGRLLTSESYAGTLNQSLAYSYNDDFSITDFTYAGASFLNEYDTDGLLTAAGNFSIFNNVDNGLPETVTDGSLTIERGFSGYGELDSQHLTVNGNPVIQWNVTRDNAGRIVGKNETVGGITSSYSYSYDSIGRLLRVTKNGVDVESYDYDLNGTRVSETNGLRGIDGRILAYSDEDHLLSAGSASYQYDLDGFLTQKVEGAEVTTYAYSLRGELLQVGLPDGRMITYEHDPLGRRIAKRVDGITVKKYLWQGRNRLLAVYDGADNLVQRFVYADGRMPVAMAQEGMTYYLAYDPVGSLRMVTDASGNTVKRIDYDSFGNILVDTNPSMTVPFGFAGGLHDRDTGLVRFGYRDYDPDIGRWTAKDPIGFAGGDTDLYGYVFSDPVNFVDPYGLEMSDIIPGVRKAIVEGTKGGFHAVSEAGKFVGTNIQPSEKTLNITIDGATVLGTASGISGNIPATATFTFIGVSASALKSSLYSDTPCNDAITQSIQSAVQAPPAIDPIVDKIIEESMNVYIKKNNLPKM